MMNTIQFSKITSDNFFANSIHNHSLNSFIRYQEVKECWRKVNNEWKLEPICFTEEWNADKLYEIAKDIICTLQNGFGYIAFDGKNIVGFAVVNATLIGEKKEYMELTDFQVSKPYREQGIGKKLFSLIIEEAKKNNAKKIYISAHSSKESQTAYRALGCVNATWLYPKKVAEEPFDVQMEYVIV